MVVTVLQRLFVTALAAARVTAVPVLAASKGDTSSFSIAHLTVTPKANGSFEPIPIPSHEDDWLHQYVEPRQSFSKWYRSKARNLLTDRQNKLYFLPLGLDQELPFPSSSSSSSSASLPALVGAPSHVVMEKLQQFASLYFPSMEVVVLPPLVISTSGMQKGNGGTFSMSVPRVTRTRQYMQQVDIPWRVSHPYDLHKVKDKASTRQLHAVPILTALQHFLPTDGYCLLAFTMEDLFDGQRDSFVVGLASLQSRVGLFSFARYDPCFQLKFHLPSILRDKTKHDEPAQKHAKEKEEENVHGKTKGKKRKRPGNSDTQKKKNRKSIREGSEQTKEDEEENERILIARSCKVMAHEVFHMFNVGHCVYYHCCMNGSGHVAEDDSQPLHLCPVDLHKLFHAMNGFDVEERYRRLGEFYTINGMSKEAQWIVARLEDLKSSSTSSSCSSCSSSSSSSSSSSASSSSSGASVSSTDTQQTRRQSARLRQKSQLAKMVNALTS
ncbi:AmzA [Balamuthia mandrillaris]